MELLKNICTQKWFKYLLLLLFCLSLSCWSKHYDYDLYARLIVGEHFFANWKLAYNDFLSYTPTHTWYDHEYGASLFFYAFYKLFGPYGLNLINALLMFGTYYFVIKIQNLQNKILPNLMSFSLIFITIFYSLNENIVRCHMFSFFFTALIVYILEKYRIKKSKLIRIIPLLILIWNNIHGGVVVGLGITFIYLVFEALQKKDWKTYFYILLISTPLLIINPYGIEYVNFLFNANTMPRIYVLEWQNIFTYFNLTKYFPVFAICFFAFVSSLLNPKKKNITHIILVLTILILGFIHVKLLSITAIVIFALIIPDIIKMFNKNTLKALEKISYTILILTILTLPFSNPLTARSGIGKFPVKEVEFLKINNLKGNILTNFGLGSYIAYKLYPNNLIYMDGRYEEVYNNEEFIKLKHYELAENNWDDAIKDYPTDILMPIKSLDIYNFLLENQKEWIQIYEGDICGIFIRKKKAKKEYKIPSNNVNYYKKFAFDNFGQFSKGSLR